MSASTQGGGGGVQSLVTKLKLIAPTIEQILSISGTPGVSIGVVQHGQTVYTAGFGYQDIELKVAPDADSIYHVASLTKSFSAPAIMMLADDGKISLTEPLANIVPDFKLEDEWVGKNVNLLDLLSHRASITSGNSMWSQGGNRNHLEKEELVRTLASLQQVKPFRSCFLYNNMLYSLVAIIIEQITGTSYGTFMTECILEPLNMNRSFIKASDNNPDNYAKAYTLLDDESFAEIDRTETTDGTLQASAGGIRSSVNDLLKYYSEIMKSMKHDSSTDVTQKSILEQVSTMTRGHNFLPKTTCNESSYALGLLRTQLPGTFGDIGPNADLISPMPTICCGDASKLVLWHQGSYPGYLSSIFMIPEDEIALVVLTNSLAMNDAADRVGELLLEHVLGTSHKTDFVDLAQKSKDKYVQSFIDVEKQISTERDPSPSLQPLENYTGSYFNHLHNFLIKVF